MATALVLSPVSFSQESTASVSYEEPETDTVIDEARVETEAIRPQTVEINECTHEPHLNKTAESFPPDADMESDIDEIVAPVDESPLLERYAGIENLGNTCYAAASLQMLASLQSFVESVRAFAVTQQSESTLRKGFLDVMDRLEKGTTVQIDDFKAIVDEQSPLFVGYDQQDAHEFITTLLDLIDLDCKKKAEETSETTDQEAEPSHMGDQEPEHDATPTPSTPDERQEAAAALSDLSDGSASKRPRTGELDLDRMQEAPCYACPSHLVPSPFSALDNDGIGQLIYGTTVATRSLDLNTEPAHNSTIEVCTPPRCKLVGGRMNTEGIQWQPLQPKLPESDMAVDTPNRVQHRAAPPDNSFDALHNEDDATQVGGEATKSPVDTSFLLTCRVQMICDSCKYARSHEETYSHLSLEIGSDSGSVEEGLRRFFAPEKLECKCEKCFAESATRTLTVMDLPRCLLLHFKRFIVDISDDYTSISYRKNRSNVAFDDMLSFEENSLLNEYLDGSFDASSATQRAGRRYSLMSVINHIGSTASCGHYTADCKRLDQQNGDIAWYRFNDEHVQSVSATTAIEDSQRTAYLVAYELDC